MASWLYCLMLPVDGNCTTIDCGDAQAETFHVCYYNDEHYDSIRSIDDDLTGAPTQIRHDTAGSGKICVEDNASNTTSAKDTASRGIERVPHTPELQLVQLWAKLNCDENRVRRKLAKRIVKTNKRK
ncbi:hypothetical protein AaE_000854 [Aphanomyces astaci]|uniref:OTU domain-containing protein n=1 Tax=Aphanomyces astaci TaxID=112090 RepID=A0A6A5ATA3_APHAT|nr:hypothetical protein AaE_000854 [Aphanomyces astaci]